jgi:hypothetical protein
MGTFSVERLADDGNCLTVLLGNNESQDAAMRQKSVLYVHNNWDRFAHMYCSTQGMSAR